MEILVANMERFDLKHVVLNVGIYGKKPSIRKSRVERTNGNTRVNVDSTERRNVLGKHSRGSALTHARLNVSAEWG